MLYGQLAVFAEFERERIRDRTRADMQAEKDFGVDVGKPRLIQPEAAGLYARELSQGGITIAELAERIGVAPPTQSRASRRVGLATYIRRRMATLGGVDLLEHRDEPVGEPPSFHRSQAS